MKRHFVKYSFKIGYAHEIIEKNITPKVCTCKAQTCRGLFIPRDNNQTECLWEEQRRIDKNDPLPITQLTLFI